MMKKIACLAAAVALTVSSTAPLVDAKNTIERRDATTNTRQRRMKKESDPSVAQNAGRTAPQSHQNGKPFKETKRHEQTDDWNDEYFDHGDDEGYTLVYEYNEDHGKRGGKRSDSSSHDEDDMVYYDDIVYEDDHYYYDDYYYHESKGKGKGGKGKGTKKSSKKSKSSKKKGKGKGKGMLDDDFYGGDDFFSPGQPRPTVLLEGRVASPPALLSAPVGGNTDPTSIGTIYPFGNVTFNADAYGDTMIPLYIEQQELVVNIRLDGYCTRTGNPPTTVEGYCHFTYTITDPSSFITIGLLTAEGPLANPNMMENNPCSGLQVTGGTGAMTAASGMVQFCPSALNDDFSPPLLVSSPLGDDLFEDAEAYEHILSIFLDQEFVFF